MTDTATSLRAGARREKPAPSRGGSSFGGSICSRTLAARKSRVDKISVRTADHRVLVAVSSIDSAALRDVDRPDLPCPSIGVGRWLGKFHRLISDWKAWEAATHQKAGRASAFGSVGASGGGFGGCFDAAQGSGGFGCFGRIHDVDNNPSLGFVKKKMRRMKNNSANS